MEGAGAAQLDVWELRNGSGQIVNVASTPTSRPTLQGRLWTSITINPSAPDSSWPRLSNTAYTTANPYVTSSLGGQCTAYVWGRALEKVGKKIGITTAAGQVYKDTAVKLGYTVSKTPKTNSIAVWKDDKGSGHVAFVENVNGTRIAWTEANFGSYGSFASVNDPAGKTSADQWGGGFDGQVQSSSITSFENHSTGFTFLGYIYL